MIQGFEIKDLLVKIKKKQISTNEALTIFKIILEESNILKDRLISIKALESLQTDDKRIYHIFENLIVSDNNPKIRSRAAIVLLDKYLDYSKNILKWVLENERSLEVLITINKFLSKSTNYIHKRILYEMHNSLSNLYKVELNEVEFLLEIEKMISKSNEIGNYHPCTDNKHIISLELGGNNINNLPNSIGRLSHLKNLNLWNNNLSKLPKSLEKLSNLEKLYLDWNYFSRIPEISWFKLKSLKKLSLTNNFNLNSLHDSLFNLAKTNFAPKYKKEGVKSEQSAVLGLIEILTGQKLEKIPEPKFLNKHYACNYRINHFGDVIGIYLYGYHSFQINFFPRKMEIFHALEELVFRDQNLKDIPEWVAQFKQLRNLDLMNNRIKELPVSIEQCMKLRYLDLERNEIQNLNEVNFQKINEVWI